MLHRAWQALVGMLARLIGGAGRSGPPRITFAPPLTWSTEEVEGGTLLLAPGVEAGWQANIFVEVRVDRDRRPLFQGLDDLAPNLRARKPDFREVGREFGELPSGLRYGRLEYTCSNEGTPLTEWEVVVELGGRDRLFVVASAASATWDRYQPAFNSFVQSIGLAEPSAAADRGRT